jgi:hypothetical protein
MKHSFVLMVATLLFTSAQARQNWLGLRTGYPLGLTVHYGIENALDNGFDLRISGNVRAYGSNVEVGIGIAGMSDIVALGTPSAKSQV